MKVLELDEELFNERFTHGNRREADPKHGKTNITINFPILSKHCHRHISCARYSIMYCTTQTSLQKVLFCPTFIIQLCSLSDLSSAF